MFGLCNLTDIFPVSRFQCEADEAILEENHITRDLGIPCISFPFALESKFLEVISFLEYSLERFQSI